MSKVVNVYLVSDSTGETVLSVSRSALAHFEDLEVEEHLWTLVRSKAQIDKLVVQLQKKKGIVMFTIANMDLQDYLRDLCSKLQILAIPVLSEVVSTLSSYLGLKTLTQPGRQHKMNEEYFSRINAINFTLAHDDGLAGFDINQSDIILVGPSRTSKSPTSIYLAYRGYKTANIPFVVGQKFPDLNKKFFIVGLIINLERLIDIRKNRMTNIKELGNSYVDYENVQHEILEAKKLYQKNKWPIIDVTRKSVEEIAANVIKLYEQNNLKNNCL